MPVGQLLALAPAGPDHQRLGGGDLVCVGVGGGDPMGVEHAVEYRRRRPRLALGVGSP